MIATRLENIVIKIGGATLFGGASFLESMRAIASCEPQRRKFVLLGGGETVESMRSLHALFPQLASESMHWRCVRLLDATWEIGCELFPGVIGIATWDDLMGQAQHGPLGATYLVRASAFYSPQSLSGIPQELRPVHDWETTTDALSWVLAKLIGATEVRIAKRCPVEPDMTVTQAAQLGMIDSELARLVRSTQTDGPLQVRFIHLREST